MASRLGWFVLGSMRVERDFQYAKADLRPYSAPAYYVAASLAYHGAWLMYLARSSRVRATYADT